MSSSLLYFFGYCSRTSTSRLRVWLYLICDFTLTTIYLLYFNLMIKSFLFSLLYSERCRGVARILANETGTRRRPEKRCAGHLRIGAVVVTALRLLRHPPGRIVLRQFSGNSRSNKISDFFSSLRTRFFLFLTSNIEKEERLFF